MCESYPEQRPLLCDDFSDEEFKIQKSSISCQRRLRNPAFSGRVKGQLKGAAAVISQWPEHLSSLLAYWWAGIGMIAVTIFIIYNCFSIIGNVPPISAMHLSVIPRNNLSNKASRTDSESLNIFMHIFAKEHEEVYPDNYLPHIKIMAKKHRNFKYNLIIVINDIPSDINIKINDKDNNEMAMNSLWTEKIKYDKQNWIENISVQYIPLTNYLDESPLKKQWRRLPPQLIEFLVRCVAIWERGGIAFNPIILTPQSPSPIYMEKLQYLLRKYSKHVNHKYKHKEAKKKFRPSTKSKVQVNNIYDIIKAIENDEIEQNIAQYNLTEAEYRENRNIKVDKRDALVMDKVETVNKSVKEKNTETLSIKDKNMTKVLINGTIYDPSKQTVINLQKNISNHCKANTSTDNNSLTDDNTTKESLLPMFLKYLFHEEGKKFYPSKDSAIHGLHINKSHNAEKDSVITEKKYDFNKTTSRTLTTDDFPVEIINLNKPVNNMNELINELTIDLKGDFIATKSWCHAFIGTIFSNTSRYSSKEKVTEFIIAELSLFCKGLLSSCGGVDVILL